MISHCTYCGKERSRKEEDKMVPGPFVSESHVVSLTANEYKILNNYLNSYVEQSGPKVHSKGSPEVSEERYQFGGGFVSLRKVSPNSSAWELRIGTRIESGTAKGLLALIKKTFPENKLSLLAA